MGLKVENAQDTLDRARALGAEPFEQARSPDEVALPAIKGLGDGLLYFLDTTSALANVWSTEFVGSDAGAPQRGAGLTFIDHVAQTMHYDEMLTWTLFYSSLFVVDKTPMVDIVDPSGLVRSRVIESKDGRLRLTLNGAENTRTLAGHFIRETVGSGVQHVAFTTEDIFSTAEKLGNSGFVALQISRNYYGDVQARFGLDDATIARLQEHNILYDRDAGGEFFQLYSPNYKAGFFFEIVERRGNYVGYGGPNAPFRIAAQKRSLKVDQ
jgi:4-hydroxyphenylpyruvate dioxygenase